MQNVIKSTKFHFHSFLVDEVETLFINLFIYSNQTRAFLSYNAILWMDCNGLCTNKLKLKHKNR